MARTDVGDAQQPDATAISLQRLLSRLEHTLLAGDRDRDALLRTSSFERNRVGANLEYARSLLLRLEHDPANAKPQSRPTKPQADLRAQRDLVKRLNERLYELNQLDDTSDESDASSSADEDVLDSVPHGPAASDPAQADSGQASADTPSSTLRSRRPQQTAVDTGTATGNAFLPPRASPTNPLADPSLAGNETLLTHNRAEQEKLTSSLLTMAQALKNQSVQFGVSLESDKGRLDRATEGLDKNQTGMEAAGKRIGSLQRISNGWWGLTGRIFLYLWIAGLWIVAFLVVFVMPKLRF